MESRPSFYRDKLPQNADEIAALLKENVFAPFQHESEENRAIRMSRTESLLRELHTTGYEQRADVLANCATVMKNAAVVIDSGALKQVVRSRNIAAGDYQGGLCDIVGTGGDGHNTFNISTAASIIASSHLLIAKHGNVSSTSKSGSADVVQCMRPKDAKVPKLATVSPQSLSRIYAETNYAFLFAPNFHTGLGSIKQLRKEMKTPTIFNLLGPLANPAYAAIEAQVIGVKNQSLIEIFAEAIRLNGGRKALVTCGAEDLDEISCAGPTNCIRLYETRGKDGKIVVVKTGIFQLHPEDFGFHRHPLSEVKPGQGPEQNAEIMLQLLSNDLPEEDPILDFVLMNASALFVVSGLCDGPSPDGEPRIEKVGPGGGYWLEGVRLARKAVINGTALDMFTKFAKATNA